MFDRSLKTLERNISQSSHYKIVVSLNRAMMESTKQTFFDAVGRGADGEIRRMITTKGKKLMVQLARSTNDLGETPLILAVKGNNEEMVKLLVEKLDVPIGQTGRFVWKGIDYQAVPPLFAAILTEADSMPILKFLIEKDLPENNNSPAGLDSIISSSVPRTQKIDILKLIGAVFIWKKCFLFAVKCWIPALALCQSTEDVGPFPQDSDERFRRLIGNAFEITSVEQLLPLASSFNPVAWNTQALLVSRRILNRIDPGGFHLLFIRLCIQHSLDLFERGQLVQMFNVTIFIAELFAALQLETFLKFQSLTVAAFACMSLALCTMFENPDPQREDPSIENIIRAIRSASVLIYKHQRLRLEGKLSPDPTTPAERAEMFAFTGSVFDMFVVTKRMSLYLYQLARKEVNFLQVKKQLIIQYNQFIKENPGVLSLLHLAVILGDSTVVPIELIQLLLKTGADPNAVDIYGNTPLHLLALNLEREDRRDVAKLLLDAGCHFDQVNANGETAVILSKKPRGARAHPFVQIVPSLFCCCAQVIVKHKIPFKRVQIPTDVQSNIQLHVAKGPRSAWFSDYFVLQSPQSFMC